LSCLKSCLLELLWLHCLHTALDHDAEQFSAARFCQWRQ